MKAQGELQRSLADYFRNYLTTRLELSPTKQRFENYLLNRQCVWKVMLHVLYFILSFLIAGYFSYFYIYWKKKRMVLYENVEVIPQFMQPVIRIKIM